MAFPSSVISDLVSGIPGEIAFDTPTVAVTAIVNTDTAANNVFGRAFTYRDEAIETVQAGGTGLFAGILINPKGHADNTLAATADTTPNGRDAELLVRGEVYVLLTVGTAVTIGDGVFFVNATGALGAGTAGAGQTQIAGATVVRHSPSAANAPSLAVIRLA
jgi:hypothetical protein